MTPLAPLGPLTLSLTDLPFPGVVLLAEDAAGGLGMFLPILIVFVIFYLLVFRPASREKKARELQVRNLKKHDRVITNAGIHGTVVAMDAETVTLRVDDKSNVRIRFSRAAVWQIEPEGGSPKGATPAEDPADAVPAGKDGSAADSPGAGSAGRGAAGAGTR